MEHNTKENISISAGSIFKIAAVGFLIYLLYILRDLILLIVTAVVIASVVEPYSKWLRTKHFPRLLSVVTVYLFILIVLVVLFYFVIPPLLGETVSVLNNLPQYIKTIDLVSPIKIGAYGSIQSFFPNLPANVSVSDIVSSVVVWLSGFSGDFVNTLINIFGGVFNFVIAIVISFYLAVREDGVAEFLGIITPLKHEKFVIDIWKKSEIKIGRWMQGQVLLGVIIGILIYFGLVILNVQHPFLLACLAATFELIPIFGMTLAGIPAFMLGFIDGGITLGLLVIALYVIVQQFESNLIYPLVVKKIVGVPPLVVIIALIAGGKLAGFLGVILSVPISVALMEYIEEVEKRKRFSIDPETRE